MSSTAPPTADRHREPSDGSREVVPCGTSTAIASSWSGS